MFLYSIYISNICWKIFNMFLYSIFYIYICWKIFNMFKYPIFNIYIYIYTNIYVLIWYIYIILYFDKSIYSLCFKILQYILYVGRSSICFKIQYSIYISNMFLYSIFYIYIYVGRFYICFYIQYSSV